MILQPIDLGKNIRELRISRKMTQQELADLLSIAPQTLSKWERGASYLDVFYLQKLAAVLNVSLLEFFKAEGATDKDDYYIAIDGGGTKTEFARFTADGKVVATAMYEATNPNSGGIEKSLSILKKGIDCISSSEKPPLRIYAGVAGVSVGNHSENISSFLKKTYPMSEIDVVSDIRNIIGLVRENKKCISAIMGTGSVVYGWDGTDLKRIGGWGYLFGDEGSGYDIGRKVLIEAYAYSDGLAPVSEVARLVENKLGGPVVEHAEKLYREGRSYIASFCPIAFEALAMGDKVAKEIISESIARFANLINHMYRLGEYGNRVILSGGIAMHDETIADMVKIALDSGITVDIPIHPPIFGAMRTCLELDGIKVDYDALKAKFDKSYNKK